MEEKKLFNSGKVLKNQTHVLDESLVLKSKIQTIRQLVSTFKS